jgi:glucosamine-6-phosphate deaminase
MNWQAPDYLRVTAEELGQGTPVKVRIGGDQQAIAEDFARAILAMIRACAAARKAATLILPVGPVDQFPILAGLINEQKVDCSGLVIINMDEYLDDDDRWVPIDHPLSFRGFMNRKFYDLVDPTLAPRLENRVFPDPANCGAIGRLIEQRGGVDVCFGGIGINGHLAFNEPPEPGEVVSVEEFAARPTRVLDLSRETRTINSVTVGGDIGVIPRRAVTVGMQEILAAKKLRFYSNRLWQRGVVRRALHGPLTAACPASLFRLHPDAQLTIANYVAEPPDIRLR